MENIDTRIAVSMAALAGLLAIVSLFANRSSGNMITYQAKANNLQAQANMARTKATDMWSYFQAKVLRRHMYEISGSMLNIIKPIDILATVWIERAKRYGGEASDLLEKATALDKKADTLQKEATQALNLSIKENKKADTLDLSRLCSEIGLVLCSIALVSKRRFLWFSGIAFGTCSLAVLTDALFIL